MMEYPRWKRWYYRKKSVPFHRIALFVVCNYLFFADQFNLARYFPNCGVAFVAAACFGNSYLGLARADLTYSYSHCARAYIVDFVIFSNLNVDGLKGENLQRLFYRVAAFYGLPVVGVCKRPIIAHAVIGD